jgi:hypothetical protein
MLPPFKGQNKRPELIGQQPASIGLPFIQKFADNHPDFIDGAQWNFFLREIDDLGMVTDRTLYLYCFGFISHTPLPARMCNITPLIFRCQ